MLGGPADVFSTRSHCFKNSFFSRLQIRDLKFVIASSRFEVRDSKFAIRSVGSKVRDSSVTLFACSCSRGTQLRHIDMEPETVGMQDQLEKDLASAVRDFIKQQCPSCTEIEVSDAMQEFLLLQRLAVDQIKQKIATISTLTARKCVGYPVTEMFDVEIEGNVNPQYYDGKIVRFDKTIGKFVIRFGDGCRYEYVQYKAKTIMQQHAIGLALQNLFSDTDSILLRSVYTAV